MSEGQHSAPESITDVLASRDWLRITLESIGDGIITTDASGNITFLNGVAQSLTGWSLSDAAGKPLPDVFNIVNQETRRGVENPALRALSDGIIVGLANHTVLISRDGVERNIDDSAAPIRNGQDRVAGAVLIFRDISERYEAEQRLRESEEAYRTLVTQVTDYAIFRTDPEGRAVTWNEGVQRLLGFTEEEFIGADIKHVIFTPEDIAADVPRLELETAAETGAAGDDRWMRRKNGERFYANGATTALRDRSGALLGFTKVMRDETEKRLGQEAAARLAAIVTYSDEAIASKDLSGIVTSWNAAAERVFGYTAEEMIGAPIERLIPEDHPDEEPQILERIRRGELIDHYETVRRRKDGRLINVSLTVSPIRDAAGNIVGASKIARDITDRIAMEQMILQQTEALAAESRRKDEFLAMLSHELRNPLAPIRSAVHLLKLHKDGENPVQRQAREIIERQVANLTELLNDLLEVSRVISGRVRLNLQPIDVNQVLQHALETVKPLIEQRRHTLDLQLCSDHLWAQADPTRIEEVFINLLNNAAKYTDEGGRIEIHCETVAEQGLAQVRIRDNGVGIDKNLLPYVFDLFTQAERSMDRSAGGLGIGLSLVHRLVQLHGGSVSAESPPPGANVGSEFTVRLPTIPAPSAGPSQAPRATAPIPAGLRVLIVDDNIDMVMMLASALRAKGYNVENAYTGHEGLRLAHAWAPDVILLDIGLPGLDGYEVARRLRAGLTDDGEPTPAFQGRLIAITGYGRDSDVARARDAGFNAHVTKPYDFDQLERLILALA